MESVHDGVCCQVGCNIDSGISGKSDIEGVGEVDVRGLHLGEEVVPEIGM